MAGVEAWRNASEVTTTGAGVLRPEEFARYVELERFDCADDLSPWVDNYWMLRWDLPAGTSYLSSTLPHPACTLSVERGHPRSGVGPERVVVTGVLTRRFDVHVAGQGWVFGVKFRPGGLASLTGTGARELRDATVHAAGVFDAATCEALEALGPDVEPATCRRRVDAALTPESGTPEADYVFLLQVISEMLTDRSMIRVAELEDRFAVTARRLQRLFAHYVGVSPKWVLARYRMHDVVTELDEGYAGSLADLATRYGWFDQAHFTREFTRLVGCPPGSYQRPRA
ncbi:putative transcriptional regulator [metagenome]|uniref:Putative transcriptional regulator n=1 Tax=metagenome TaxID=256318 RepID=A0A2P2CC77_9ZZZZ